MIWLILGLLLWSGSHLFKRLAPDARAGLGDKGKGLVAVASLAGIVLMVIGYRAAEGAVFWGKTPAMTGINNLLMVLAFYLYAASGAKTWITTRIRHPQLTAVKVWAVAHLLVNGDVPSFVLFGGLLAWAVASMILINKRDGVWLRPPESPRSRDVLHVAVSVAVFAAVAGVHNWLGVWPFPG